MATSIIERFESEERKSVRLSIEQLDRVINALEDRQKKLARTVRYNGLAFNDISFLKEFKNNADRLQVAKDEYLAIQQQIETLSVMRRYIEILNGNFFFPKNEMLQILKPNSMELATDNIQTYFDNVCDNILSLSDDKRAALLNFFVRTLFLSLVAAGALGLGCFFHAPIAALMVLSGVTSLFLVIGLVGTGVVVEQNAELIKAKDYLDKAKKSEEVTLVTDESYFLMNTPHEKFRLEPVERGAIHLENDTSNGGLVYCHIRSGLKGRDYYKTIPLSPKLSGEIRDFIGKDTVTLGKKDLNTQLADKKADIIREIKERPFTTMIHPDGSYPHAVADLPMRERCVLTEARGKLKISFFNGERSIAATLITTNVINGA